MKDRFYHNWKVWGVVTLLFLATDFSSSGQSKVVHLVLFKLKPGILTTDPRLTACLDTLKNLPTKIPQIQEFTCGKNFSDRSVAFDVGLYSTFASKADLHLYLNHPAHQSAAKAMKEIAEWNVADYEIP
ncbi:MAG TPA: Dabb family protein [Catalimonadaceae bacterium]|nr:Dabb family protein [Catalimonadaceae bacterium]